MISIHAEAYNYEISMDLYMRIEFILNGNKDQTNNKETELILAIKCPCVSWLWIWSQENQKKRVVHLLFKETSKLAIH